MDAMSDNPFPLMEEAMKREQDFSKSCYGTRKVYDYENMYYEWACQKLNHECCSCYALKSCLHYYQQSIK